MTGYWIALAVLAVGVLLLVPRWNRRRIRRSQVRTVRAALDGWLTKTPVSPLGDGSASPGSGNPDPDPVEASRRVHIEMGGPGRHRLAA
jgi:hypothetical protein